MGDIAYVNRGPDLPVILTGMRVERLGGPERTAYLPGDEQPTVYGAHGAIAEHYGAKPGQFPSRASTIDHLVGAALG